MRSHRSLVAGGLAAVGAGAGAMVGLHLSAGLDPVWDLISEYAFEPEGWLLPTSLTLLAAGAGMFATVMLRHGADRRIVALVQGWAVCMLLIGVFPTDRPGVPLSLSGGIHRYAAFVAFLAMPVAGLLLARRIGHRRTATALKTLSGLAFVALVAVVVPYLLDMAGMPVTPEDLPAGLTQRLVVATELGVLVLLGATLLREAGKNEGPVPPSRRPSAS